MRDYLVLAIVFSGVPIALRSPWIGVLFFYWVSLMNPHRLTWTFARDWPVAKALGLATILGLLLSHTRPKLYIDVTLGLIVLFSIHFTLTTWYAVNPPEAWQQWEKASKIFLMTFITAQLITNKLRFETLILVIMISLGFYGVKGGLFAIATGGKFRVWGPEGTFIGDNNDLGLALNMVLPFFYFYGLNERKKILRSVYFACFFLSILAIVSTYSRGAFLALGLVLLSIVFTLEGYKKVLGLLTIVVCAVAILNFAPENWFSRMQSIETFQQDVSAMGRINAWWFAFNLANARPLLGGGFGAFNPDLFRRYAPDPEDFHDAHSIYFEVLGEHGYIGLALFLMIILRVFVSLAKVRRASLRLSPLNWAKRYIAIFTCSMVAYLGNGLTLGLAYFDFYWLIVVLVVCLERIVKNQLLHLANPSLQPTPIRSSEPVFQN